MHETFVYNGDNQAIPEDFELLRVDSTVKIIEKYAFEDCQNLKFVYFCEGLQEVGSNGFSSCTSLQSIRLPSTVRVIQKGAFYNCENLKYVILNEGLEIIEKDAFYGCGVELLCLPSTVKYVRTGSFENCGALKRVALNEGLVKVENYAFNQCDMLESIEIPSSSDSPTIEMFAIPEKTAKVSVKDVQFWNDVQRRYEQEDISRMEKYGIVVEEDAKMSIHPASKPSPRDESRPMKKPRTSSQAPAAAVRKMYTQETREDLQQKLVDKRQQIEWLQKLLASAQNERDELEAKLNDCDMPPPGGRSN